MILYEVLEGGAKYFDGIIAWTKTNKWKIEQDCITHELS